MIPLEPWLVPLLIMAALIAVVAVVVVVNKARTKPISVGISGSTLRILAFGAFALILAVGAIYTLVVGDEIVTRLTAFATFIPAAVGAYYALAPIFKRQPGRSGGHAADEDQHSA